MSEQLRNDMERDARLAALYRAAAQDAPPPTLDDAIRAAARRAVASKPRSVSPSFSRAWRVPLSIAAVLVLSVSLVTLMREEAPEMTQPPGVDSSLPQSAAQRQRAESAPMAEEPSLAAPKTAAADQKSSGLGLKSSASGEGLRRDQESIASVAQLRKETTEQRGAQGPSPAKQVPPEAFPGASARRANRAAAPTEPPRQAVQEAARDMATGEPQRPSATPAAPAENKIQARSEADSAVRESERMRAQSPVGVMKSAPFPTAKSPVPSPSATAMDKPTPQPSGVLQPYTSQPPEKWLEQITELRKQGRLEEARASFADFRRRYPDYPLPPAFREWVKP